MQQDRSCTTRGPVSRTRAYKLATSACSSAHTQAAQSCQDTCADPAHDGVEAPLVGDGPPAPRAGKLFSSRTGAGGPWRLGGHHVRHATFVTRQHPQVSTQQARVNVGGVSDSRAQQCSESLPTCCLVEGSLLRGRRWLTDRQCGTAGSAGQTKLRPAEGWF